MRFLQRGRWWDGLVLVSRKYSEGMFGNGRSCTLWGGGKGKGADEIPFRGAW